MTTEPMKLDEAGLEAAIDKVMRTTFVQGRNGAENIARTAILAYLTATAPAGDVVVHETRRRYWDTIEELLKLVTPTALTKADQERFAKIKEDHSWDGLSCSCGGGWLMGHANGCPEAAPTPSPPAKAGEGEYRPTLLRNETAGFTEFVTEDVPAITGHMFAANVEPIVRMSGPRGEVIGYRIYDALSLKETAP